MLRFPDDEDYPDEVFDPGVQQERTSLAWQRTALAFTAPAAALTLHVTSGRLLPLLPAAAMLLLGGVTLVWGWRRYERLHKILRTDAPVAAPVLLTTLATAVTAFSASALAVAWLSP